MSSKCYNNLLQYRITKPHFSFSAKLWRRCVLSGGNQRRALLQHQSKEIFVYIKYLFSSSRDWTHNLSHLQIAPLCPCVTVHLNTLEMLKNKLVVFTWQVTSVYKNQHHTLHKYDLWFLYAVWGELINYSFEQMNVDILYMCIFSFL